MDIQHRPEGDLGSFVAVKDGEDAAELAYRMTGPKEMCLDHTEVDPEHEGRNVGKCLVQAAVEYARSNGIKIKPLCTYAVVLFDRNREWDDLRC